MEDLRVKRTRLSLTNALEQLLVETSIDKISVNDICEKAMVRRATFYNHFKDKNDLLNYTIDQLQEDMFETTVETKSYSSPKEMYLALIDKTLDYLNENKSKFNLILKNSQDKLTLLILDTIKKSIRYLLAKNKYEEEYALPIEVIVNFFSGGIALIGLEWITGEQKYDKQQLMNFFDVLIDNATFKK